MNAERLKKLGRLTALLSFLLGTLIFVIYFLTSSGEWALVGLGYVVLAKVINLVIFSIIVTQALVNKSDRKELFKTSGLMLLNIPVVLFYYWFAMVLTGYMLIRFVNSTPTVLTDINIVGCETKHIDKLGIGEGTTVWVSITGDCAINMDYLSDGKRVKENVVGYTTRGMGERVYHDIGGRE